MSRRLNLSVQYPNGKANLPERAQVLSYVRAALSPEEPDQKQRRGAQITVRFIDQNEAQELNLNYRGKDYATNILSFPYAIDPLICGDLLICQPVVEREALTQNKALSAHYAHLIVHGTLHLQGYDHETSAQDAERMENLEQKILYALGFPDPYKEET